MCEKLCFNLFLGIHIFEVIDALKGILVGVIAISEDRCSSLCFHSRKIIKRFSTGIAPFRTHGHFEIKSIPIIYGC